jgi:YwhD family.
MDEKREKKPIQFQIIKNDPTDGHRGFGRGVINLENVTPVFIDVDEKQAFIDMGGLHARSQVERGIKFLPKKEEVPNGKPYWLIWVTIERGPKGAYYHGVTACEFTVDRSIRRGFKNFPDHVNKLDKSLKGHILVDHMDESSKRVLAEFLKKQKQGTLWNCTGGELKRALGEENVPFE